MKRWIALGIVVFLALAMAIGILVLTLSPDDPPIELPKTIPPILAITSTFTPTASYTPSATPTNTIAPSPTATATLATRVAQANIIMNDVGQLPMTMLQEDDKLFLEVPPDPIEPLPNATLIPAPYMTFENWIAFESDHPNVQYIRGDWIPIGSMSASRGQYHFTEDVGAIVRFPFQGEAVRVRYVGFTNGGSWQVIIDGEVVDTIDSYAERGIFTSTEIYVVESGEHVLELRNTTDSHPRSTGNMLTLDTVQVYQADEDTIIGTAPTIQPSPTLIPAQNIELIEAPPSPPPTATDVPLQVVSAAIVIGYDENANGFIDVSEGVRGISVRLVENGTNRVVAHGFTDAQGFVRLQASTNSAVQLVVPYFGESWMVSNREGEGTLSLLLSPGNQPGLIP